MTARCGQLEADQEPSDRAFKSRPARYTEPESLISPSPEDENRDLERPSSLQYDTPPRVLESIADQEEVPPLPWTAWTILFRAPALILIYI